MLGSLRLEIRRVSGHIRSKQVYWEKGDDGLGVCVFDPDGIEIIDDAERDEPPYIVFDFKFREDPKITQATQRMIEKNVDTKIEVGTLSHLETTWKSTKSDMSALPAIGKAKGTSVHVRVH